MHRINRSKGDYIMFGNGQRWWLKTLLVMIVLGAGAIVVSVQDVAAVKLNPVFRIPPEGDDVAPVASPEENKALIAAYFEALSGQAKPTAVQEQYIAASDQALKDHVDMFEAAFPLYELIAEDMIAEGDRVAVRATFRGTHAGEFAGIAASGRTVEVSLLLIYRVENGKIAEHWIQADVMGLMQQLGALPAPDRRVRRGPAVHQAS
jgi:predicted ester cyclase